MAKRILYIVPHRLQRSPGQRFRCEHFIPILEQNGYEITYSYMLSAWDDVYFYKRGAYLIKLLIFCKAFFRRVRDVFRASRYDVVFVYREAFMIGTTYFEKLYAKRAGALFFDFDDSIWLKDTSEGNQNLEWLKKPEKTNDIIRLANLVIVGNEYLAKHALQFSKSVVVIPTLINTEYHIPSQQKKSSSAICIGWTGTETTHKHFLYLTPVLQNLQEKYGDSIILRVISNKKLETDALTISWKQWSVKTEISDLHDIDIGIMPLPNDEWSQGKCGFKGLQYMALGIPTVMSPVGVNTSIIAHEKNGFLADSPEEWLQILENLIQNAQLRKQIGEEGRNTIVQEYSVHAYEKEYLALFHTHS